MSRKSLNQTGFSAIEGLLIVIIVLLVGFIGYYVHHTQQQTDTIDNAAAKVALSSPAKVTKKATTAAGTTATNTTPQQYLVIREWGVEIPLSSAISDAYYQYRATTGQDEAGNTVYGTVELGTKAFTAAYPGCGPSASYDVLGAISRYSSSVDQDNVIGNYAYSFSGPQSGCGAETTAQQQQETTLRSAFETALQSIKAVP